MADFAPSWTARLRMTYEVGGLRHRLVVRAQRPLATTATAMAGKLITVLNELSPVMFDDFNILGYEFAAQDSDVFLPATGFTGLIGGATTGLRSVLQNVSQTRFEGVSAGGSRTALVLYGLVYTPGASGIASNFRIATTEDANIAAAIVALNEVAPGYAGADGSLAVWRPYVNVKPNDAWVTHMRA